MSLILSQKLINVIFLSYIDLNRLGSIETVQFKSLGYKIDLTPFSIFFVKSWFDQLCNGRIGSNA